MMTKATKGKRNHSKKLSRGKRLEATKPLDVPVHTTTTSSQPSENLSLNFTKIKYTN
jgi:hypothetical protein